MLYYNIKIKWNILPCELEIDDGMNILPYAFLLPNAKQQIQDIETRLPSFMYDSIFFGQTPFDTNIAFASVKPTYSSCIKLLMM